MAESNTAQQKTEQPTPRRLQEARRRGQVARSSDLNGALSLLAVVIFFYLFKDHLLLSMQRYLSHYLANFFQKSSLDNPLEALTSSALYFFWLMLPLIVLVTLVGIFINIIQVGFVFSPEAARFKWDRLNPAAGFQRVFSTRGLLELVKSVIKLAALGGLTYWLVKGYLPGIMVVEQGNPGRTLSDGAQFILLVLGYGSLAYLALALLDYLHRRHEHVRELRMSRQEVKDELKQTEGDPLLKSRLRERQRQISLNRMIQEVPRATVVVTNPSHLAVALRYEQGKMNAPVVTAKGAGYWAERIKELARENRIPVIENREVARFLYRGVEVGREIPGEVYQAVAEILAVVYRLNSKKKKVM